MEITGRLKRAAAVMISAAMIIGMCGNALAEETDSSGGRETIAAEGINERNEGGMAGEGAGGMEAGAAGATEQETAQQKVPERNRCSGNTPSRAVDGREMGSETGGSGADSVSGAQDGGSQEAAEDGSEERRIPIIQTMVPREVEACGWVSMRFLRRAVQRTPWMCCAKGARQSGGQCKKQWNQDK